MRQLDDIRRDLRDFNCHAKAIDVYTKKYFLESVQVRDQMRAENEEQLDADDEGMEMTVNEEDLSGNFADAKE